MPDTLRTFPARASGGVTALIPKWKRKAATGRGGPDLCGPIGYPALTVSRHPSRTILTPPRPRPQIVDAFLENIPRRCIARAGPDRGIFFYTFKFEPVNRRPQRFLQSFCSGFLARPQVKSGTDDYWTGVWSLRVRAGERESARELGPPPI